MKKHRVLGAAAAITGLAAAPAFLGGVEVAAGGFLEITLNVETAAQPHVPVPGACAMFMWEEFSMEIWSGVGEGEKALVCDGGPDDYDEIPGSITWFAIAPPGTIHWEVSCVQAPEGYVWSAQADCGEFGLTNVPSDEPVITITETVKS